ncbi:hypothetical protein TNCV_1779621 [Trichonephila clavipes]|nr:hypothetical protein TNCV_1779621 [Trichonephila clavipes]
MVNNVIGPGTQIPVVRADVVEGESIDNRRTIQTMSAFGEHEMGELKCSSMEINDLKHDVEPIAKNLVNDMLLSSSDYEGLIENPAIGSQSCDTSSIFKERRNYKFNRFKIILQPRSGA